MSVWEDGKGTDLEWKRAEGKEGDVVHFLHFFIVKKERDDRRPPLSFSLLPK
jgi:hypothetical protein